MRPFKQLTAYVDLPCEWVSDVKYLGLTANKLAETATSLEHENAKLRELVGDMWDWLAPTAVGGGAPLKGLHDRMRELGVTE